jgi:hypothetical protein
MERVAYVNRDKGAERAEDEHGYGHGNEHESQSSMGEDEFVSSKKVLRQRFYGLLILCARGPKDL